MAQEFERCVWCGGTYPPCELSREHVLAEYLGVDALLPAGAVCKGCNNKWNTEIDQPLRLLLLPLMTSFGAKSGKRGQPAAGRFRLATSVGEIQVTRRAGEEFTVPPVQQVSGTQTFVGTVEAITEMLRKRGLALEDVQHGPVEITSIPKARMTATMGLVFRAVIRAGVHAVVAEGHAALLETPCFTSARAYVADAEFRLPELTGFVPKELKGGYFEDIDGEAMHEIVVSGEPGKPLCVGVSFFGVRSVVAVPPRWESPALQLHLCLPVSE